MKKIGILTFQNAYNYGAVLQAYALKNTIGQDCEIINYENKYFIENELFYRREPDIRKRIVKLIYRGQLKRRIKRFNEFIQNELTLNQPMIKKEQLSTLNEKYDAFITGSDQVWNIQCAGGDTSYFLDFVTDSKKKNSYAASFGTDQVSLEVEEAVKKSISDFNQISIREKSGRSIIHSLIERDATVVLDPTMLLSMEAWNQLLPSKQNNKKYILVYTVLNGDKILAYAKEVAKILGMDVYCITMSLRPQKDIKCIRDAGPLEWIEFIKNAEYVFTNSYHGLAFSLIFNKEFYIELLPPPSQTNARMKELLEQLNLMDRIITCSEQIILDNKIDYLSVNKVCEEKRKASRAYLDKIVTEENN